MTARTAMRGDQMGDQMGDVLLSGQGRGREALAAYLNQHQTQGVPFASFLHPLHC